MALYHFDSCPFCRRVRRAIDALGIDVELRNFYDDSITTPAGEDRWMPESAEIIRYLNATYPQAA